MEPGEELGGDEGVGDAPAVRGVAAVGGQLVEERLEGDPFDEVVVAQELDEGGRGDRGAGRRGHGPTSVPWEREGIFML